MVYAILVIAILFSVTTPARAQLYTMETENLKLIYNYATQSFIAPHALRCFENSMNFHRPFFDDVESMLQLPFPTDNGIGGIGTPDGRLV